MRCQCFPTKFYGQLSNIILSRVASTNKAGAVGGYLRHHYVSHTDKSEREVEFIFLLTWPTGLWSEDRVDILTGEPGPRDTAGHVCQMRERREGRFPSPR